jgi:hypothetical protein
MGIVGRQAALSIITLPSWVCKFRLFHSEQHQDGSDGSIIDTSSRI